MQLPHFGLLLAAVLVWEITPNFLVEASKSRRLLIDPDHMISVEKHNMTGEHTVTGPISHKSLDKEQTGANEIQTSSESVSVKLESKKTSPEMVVSDGRGDEVANALDGIEIPRTWSLEDLRSPFCRNCKGLIDYQSWMTEMGANVGTKMLLILLGVALIWLLGTTARDFFVPSLFYWSEHLKLSPEVAGATLLALGNGAPDIFAVTMAANKDDLPLALSEMLGANMFTLCVTGGAVVLACYFAIGTQEGLDINPAQGYVNPSRLGVTLATYFLALAALSWNLMSGKPSVMKALCLPALYIAYLLSLWFYNRKRNGGELASSIAMHAQETRDASGEAPLLFGLYPQKGEESPLQFALWLVCFPTYAVRWVCIPPADKHWSPLRRFFSSFSPIGIFVFTVLTNVANIQRLSIITLLGMAMLAVLASMSLYLSSTGKPQLPWFYPLLPLIAMVASVLWLAAIAGELTAIVEALGFYMQVPRLRLGFSTIAWGNSLGDLLTCLATVRHGQAGMAMAAVFAGPLIDDLIAFGLAMTSLSLHSDQTSTKPICGTACPMELKLPIYTSIIMVAIAAVLLACILRFANRQPRLGAGILFGWYVAFLVMVLVVQRADAPEKTGKIV